MARVTRPTSIIVIKLNILNHMLTRSWYMQKPYKYHCRSSDHNYFKLSLQLVAFGVFQKRNDNMTSIRHPLWTTSVPLLLLVTMISLAKAMTVSSAIWFTHNTIIIINDRDSLGARLTDPIDSIENAPLWWSRNHIAKQMMNLHNPIENYSLHFLAQTHFLTAMRHFPI